jgi:orotate phosphoribosyltransferase
MTLFQAVNEILFCLDKIEKIDCQRICTVLPKYIVVDRILNRLVRVADATFANSIKFDFSSHAIHSWTLKGIDICVRLMVNLMRGSCDQSTIISFPSPPFIPIAMRDLQIRRIIEGDNLPLIFWRTTFLEEHFSKPNTTIISPLLGGGLVAPMFAALNSKNFKVKWSYVKTSLYESNNEKNVILGDIDLSSNLALVDDNIGSGKTLNLVRGKLKEEGYNILGVTAIEMHWKKFLNVLSGSVLGDTFSLETIDNLSPFAYRHYMDMKKLYQQYYLYEHVDDQTIENLLVDSKRILYQAQKITCLNQNQYFKIKALANRLNTFLSSDKIYLFQTN